METSTWNAGTIIWLVFGGLLAWGLLAALWEWVLDLPSSISGWRHHRRNHAPDALTTDRTSIVDGTGTSEEPPGFNPWAETGYGPLGDPKLWCGTCAEQAKRADP